MTIQRRLTTLAAGLLAGLLGTAVMVLLMTIGRAWFGISPPPEAIPDRFAPTLDIKTFFDLFGRFGGYNGLKKFGIRSGLGGLVAAGALVGLLYPVVVESARSRRWGPWRSGFSRLGVGFVVVAALVLWIATLIVLWPVLDTNYRGLQPSIAQPVTAIWLLLCYAAYGAVLVLTYRAITRRVAEGEETRREDVLPVGEPIARRAVVAGAATVALAVPSYGLIRRLYDQATFSYDGTVYSGPGIEPIAPNDLFYTVTKNVVDPDVSKRVWRLRVDGHVEDPKTYSFDGLTALQSVDQETTLMCISNAIGAGLFSNANWKGVPMATLLGEVTPRDGAQEVLLHAADGYTDTFSIEKALDPTTLLVYEMNGEPLPRRHGYPVRVVVPGLYGEKNMKWITRIEVVDHDAKGFYEQQGWGPDFEHPTRSDIFSPRWRRGRNDAFTESFRVNQRATIRGRAFAGARGVESVEFSADDGQTWQPVRVDYPGTRLTWVFWSVDWRPTEPGEYVLVSRAVDGTGAPQPTEAVGITPMGARGYHRVRATVEG